MTKAIKDVANGILVGLILSWCAISVSLFGGVILYAIAN